MLMAQRAQQLLLPSIKSSYTKIWTDDWPMDLLMLILNPSLRMCRRELHQHCSSFSAYVPTNYRNCAITQINYKLCKGFKAYTVWNVKTQQHKQLYIFIHTLSSKINADSFFWLYAMQTNNCTKLLTRWERTDSPVMLLENIFQGLRIDKAASLPNSLRFYILNKRNTVIKECKWSKWCYWCLKDCHCYV